MWKGSEGLGLDGEGKEGAEELFSRWDLIVAANRVKLEAMFRNESPRT